MRIFEAPGTVAFVEEDQIYDVQRLALEAVGDGTFMLLVCPGNSVYQSVAEGYIEEDQPFGLIAINAHLDKGERRGLYLGRLKVVSIEINAEEARILLGPIDEKASE